jgi:pyruvate-formate lyase-activating enzyme
MDARLICTYKCKKDCSGCCNKNWQGPKPKEVTHFNYRMVMITGGEPLLFPVQVLHLCAEIREKSEAKIILYTALSKVGESLLYLAYNYIDGMTLTLHQQEDVAPFLVLNREFLKFQSTKLKDKLLRLNIFKGITLPKDTDLSLWKIKKEIEWIKNCPLPEGEELLRLKELW